MSEEVKSEEVTSEETENRGGVTVRIGDDILMVAAGEDLYAMCKEYADTHPGSGTHAMRLTANDQPEITDTCTLGEFLEQFRPLDPQEALQHIADALNSIVRRSDLQVAVCVVMSKSEGAAATIASGPMDESTGERYPLLVQTAAQCLRGVAKNIEAAGIEITKPNPKPGSGKPDLHIVTPNRDIVTP